MVSKKMRDDLDVVVSSFYSFLKFDECQSKVKQVVKRVNDFGAKRSLFVDVTTNFKNGKSETKKYDIEKFIQEGILLTDEVKSFEFDIILKIDAPKEINDQVATRKEETIFHSDLFVAVDDMTKNGVVEKASETNKREYINVDKIMLQDYSHGRISFEGVKIAEV